MRYDIGARSVRVRFEDGMVESEGGDVCLALSTWQEDLIQMASDAYLPPKARFATLMHELWHFWEWAHGPVPADPEHRADYMASFFCSVHRQFVRQGGETRLELSRSGGGVMSPAEAVAAGGPLHPDEPYATQCPDCTSLISSGSVIRSVAVPHETGRRVVWLQMVCGDCGKMWRWATAADEQGGNTAAPVVEPTEVTDRREVAEFCMKFPKQTGLAQIS